MDITTAGATVSTKMRRILTLLMGSRQIRLVLTLFQQTRVKVLAILLLGFVSARRKYRKALREASKLAAKVPQRKFVSLPKTGESGECPTVETTKGKIIGKFSLACEKPQLAHGSVYTFRGVPYAAPPVGKRRFKHAITHEKWNGTMDCTEFARIAPQANIMPEELVSKSPVQLVKKFISDLLLGWGLNFIVSDPQPLPAHQSEDCLFLNVDTPSLDRSKKLPVAVWIHGGGFAMGASSEAMYSHSWGHSLASDHEVVVVSINYRLGALGFLKVDGGDHNCALSDMKRALLWVQEEIEAFGGDPNNVTVFGESAGAMSIGCLLASPQINTLFHRAVLQSGACYNSVFEDHSKLLEKLFRNQLGEVDMRKVSVETILAVQAKIRFSSVAGVLPFQPVVDGDILPLAPMQAIEQGVGGHVDVLVGYNKHEWRLFAGLAYPLLQLVPSKVLEMLVAHVTGPALATSRSHARQLPKAIFDQYREEHRRLAAHMTKVTGKPAAEVDWAELYNTVQADLCFRAPATLLAKAHARMRQKGVRTYMYRFDFGSACHGLDLLFVHGTANRTDIGAHKFVLPDWFTRSRTQEELKQDMDVVLQLARDMQTSWANFFRCGRPDVPGAKMHWQQVTKEGGETMVLNSHRRYKMLLGDAHKYTCHSVYQSPSELALHELCQSARYQGRGRKSLPSTPSFIAKLEKLQQEYRRIPRQGEHQEGKEDESNMETTKKKKKGLYRGDLPEYSSEDGHAFDYICSVRNGNTHGFGGVFVKDAVASGA